MKEPDSTKRFSNRVEDYIKYRPNYPDQMIEFLRKEIGLSNSKIIADIGSGTGLSSLPFLTNGNTVYGVEPNSEMRAAMEQTLKSFPRFKSIDGTAEQTRLEDESIDIIFSGQAFHWFDRKQCKQEFVRILRENGNIILAWNQRNTISDFEKAYEQILTDRIEDYRVIRHREISQAAIQEFFSPKKLHKTTIPNSQTFDLEGLKGRLKSSSYCPTDGPAYQDLMDRITHIFTKYQVKNQIVFSYTTEIYWC